MYGIEGARMTSPGSHIDPTKQTVLSVSTTVAGGDDTAHAHLGTSTVTRPIEEKIAACSVSRKSETAAMFRQLFCHDEIGGKSDDAKSDRKSPSGEPDWSGLEGCFTKDLLPTSEDPGKTMHFLAEVVLILLDYVNKQTDRKAKVMDFHHPHQLREILDHCLGVDEKPRDLEQLLSDCKETLKYCVKTGHPRFFNQLSSGQDVVGLAGEWLIATANTNMFTYEIAPVFSLMEKVILERMREKIGWQGGGDGIFTPGGAIANLYACLCARYKALPDIKSRGLCGGRQFVMFTSQQSHFSIKRAGAIMGLGTDHVIEIPCDHQGKMIVSELERCVTESISERGEVPFFVNATGGTTVLGAIDPLNDIADVCERHGLWMHVDCAWGGAVLMSNTHRHLLDGLHRANSVTWNPHKLMGAPLQCSAILLKEHGTLEACNSMNASYLFQKDKNYDVTYDTGDKSIQCGRHNDIYKLWLMWRSKGDKGFEDHVDKVFKLADYARERIKSREGFEFVLEKGEMTNICFWYIPVRLRDKPRDESWSTQLGSIAPKIKALMMEAGTALIGYQPLGTHPNFFRWVVSNDAVTNADIDYVIDEIDKYGRDL